MQIYEEISPFFITACLVCGFFIGFLIASFNRTIEIQNIKPIENGYYITINDEIYYKEVENGK